MVQMAKEKETGIEWNLEANQNKRWKVRVM